MVKSFVQEKNQLNSFTKVSDELTKTQHHRWYAFLCDDSVLYAGSQLSGRRRDLLCQRPCKRRSDIDRGIASFMNYLMQIMMAIIIGGMMMMMTSRAAVSQTIERNSGYRTRLVLQRCSTARISRQCGIRARFFPLSWDEKKCLTDISFQSPWRNDWDRRGNWCREIDISSIDSALV